MAQYMLTQYSFYVYPNEDHFSIVAGALLFQLSD